jgi:histone H3/H4
MPKSRLPVAPCHRGLQTFCGIPKARVGQQAAIKALEAVEDLLYRAGVDAAKDLRLMKKKTVTVEVLADVLVKACTGIKRSDLDHEPRGAEVRGLPKIAVVDCFSKGLGDFNIADKAKSALVGAATAYLRALSERAGLFATAGKRQTINAGDVSAARKLLE